MLVKNSILERLNHEICKDNIDCYIHLEADHLIESFINLCSYINEHVDEDKAKIIQEKLLLALKTKNGQKFQKFFENQIINGIKNVES